MSDTPRTDLAEVTQAIIDLRAEIVVAIMRRHDVDDADGEPSLSAAQHLTLSVLRDGPLSVSDIAERTGVRTSTTTRMLQGLKRLDLVVPAPIPTSDRRRRYVDLTDAGRRVADARTERLVARVSDLVADVTPEDAAALLRGVRVFADALQRSAARRAGAGVTESTTASDVASPPDAKGTQSTSTPEGARS